ncbi:MAG: radical SAM protein [Armatimonadetes bacterium]|nr:radical SAM protein [Armatimonadota bacterium]
MVERHFPLLSVRGGNRVEFSGPLARVLSPRLKDNAAVKAYISTVGRLKRGRQIELLGMTTQITDSDVFLASATGPMSSIPDAKRAVKSVQDAVQRRGKPIIKRNDTLIYTSYQPPIPTSASMKLLGNHLALELDGHPQPTVCTLQVTTKCQANCVHCSADRFKDPKRSELTTDEWKRVIADSQKLGVVSVVFTGGEPLIRPDIYDLIDYVDKDEAVALMFCNGLLLDVKNVKKLASAGLHAIHVSIDSPDPGEHDEMRGVPGCFQKAVDGLMRCKGAGIITGISTYATPERLHNGQVIEMLELAKKIGTDEITIFDVVPTGRLLMEDRKHLLTDEDKAELCRIEEEYNEGHPLPQVITQAHINGPTGNGCFAGWCQFYVTAFGDVTPCDFTPLSFGNVRDEGVETPWQRIICNEDYCNHRESCRMQNPEFRARWIDRIPGSGPFPYPVADLDALTNQPEDEDLVSVAAYSSLGIKH